MIFVNFSATSEEVTTNTVTMDTTREPITMEPTVSEGLVTEGTTDIGGVATVKQIVVKDYQVLEIGLPIGLLMLLVVMVAVVVGVLVCVSQGRKYIVHKYDVPLDTRTNSTTRILDDSDIYYSPTEAV